MNDVVIVGATRTPHGLFGGKLSRLSAPELGAIAVRGLLPTVGYDPQKIDTLIMGCVLQAGLGQAPARQVIFKSGLSPHVNAYAVNKVCGSGLQSIISGFMEITLGYSTALIAGGMESMSRAPYLIERSKKGEAPKTEPFGDHLFLDGLEDAYQKKTPMGIFAEEAAKKYGFTREEQDDFSITSLERAQEAVKSRYFETEIVPIVIQEPSGTLDIHDDENLGRATAEKIKQLRPAFLENGTITAASASGIADGASALMMMSSREAKKNKIEERAQIKGVAMHSHDPKWFTLAPIEATKKLLASLHWTVNDVDIFEVNEAFAVVPMAFMKELGISHKKVNVHGGACAIGHPIGSSGCRIVVSLLNVLERLNKRRGIATVCIGGGEALAIALERQQ